jgi:hypothetical protein
MRKDTEKEALTREIHFSSIEKINGSILRVLGLQFGLKFERLSDVLVVFRDESESEVYEAVAYLHISGYVTLRERESKLSIDDVYRFDLDELDIRLTREGAHLLSTVARDPLVKI